MNTAELLENLRDELDTNWSDSHGGYTNVVVKSLTPDDPDLQCYLKMISMDSHISRKARRLATRALEEVRDDGNFLARCGIKAEDLGEPT